MPFGLGGLFEDVAELGFQHAVDAAHLLLFAKLQAVAHHLRLAILAVLAGNEVAPLDGALLAVAAFALEKKLHALAPALPANGTDVSCQVSSPYLSYIQVQFTVMADLHPAAITRIGIRDRRLLAAGRLPYPSTTLCASSGGRHPLCGIGVTSLMARTPVPAVRQRAHRRFTARTRTADPHFHHPQSALVGLVGRRHGRLLRGERSTLAGPAEPQRTGARPGDRVAFLVR